MNRNKWQRVPAPNTRGAKMHGWVREMDEAYSYQKCYRN